MHRDAKQYGIRDLTIALNTGAKRFRQVHNRLLQRPKLVVSQPCEPVQHRDSVQNRDTMPHHRRVARHPHETSLRQRTSRPTIVLTILEPRSSRRMVNMIRPSRRN